MEVVKHFDGIVRGASAWRGQGANQSRVADTAHINPAVLVIPRAPVLTHIFANAVYRAGQAKCRLFGDRSGARSKHCNRTGPEDLCDAVHVGSEVQDMEQPFHIEVPSPLRLLLSAGAKSSGEMVYMGDLVRSKCSAKRFLIAKG